MFQRIAKRVASFPAARVLIFSITLWLLLFVYCNYALWRDPHGAYFHSEHIYDQDYSHVRQQDARDFLQQHSDKLQSTYGKAGRHPALCAAFVTVRREHPDAAHYFSDAIGSMLEGLAPQERAALNVSVLFANVPDPARHPDFHAPWVSQLIDHASGYEGLPESELAELSRLEEAEDFQRKGVLDYLYVLEQCYRDTRAPFIAVFEDDIVFAADWMARTLLGLQSLAAAPPSATSGDGSETDARSPWLYLRLFYTETFMGWHEQNDYWYAHLPFTFALVSFTCATVLVLIHQLLNGFNAIGPDSIGRDTQVATGSGWSRFCKPLGRLGLQLDFPTIAVLSFIVAPAFTALIFMAGKYNLPMYALREGLGRTIRNTAPGGDARQKDVGVFPMDAQGCCTQALVFDRARVPELMTYLRDRGRGQTDLMIEDYCRDNSLRRFALGEQAVQHVGIMSSRGSGTDAQSVWAFYFEQSQADAVRMRHESLLEKIDWDVFQKGRNT